jgi:hypothetical protein
VLRAVLLYLDQPIVNFGHNRWREAQQYYDAARWLSDAGSAAAGGGSG